MKFSDIEPLPFPYGVDVSRSFSFANFTAIERFILRELLSAIDPPERKRKYRSDLEDLHWIPIGEKLHKTLVPSGSLPTKPFLKKDEYHHVTPIAHEKISLRKRNIRSHSRPDEMSRYERHKQRNRISMQKLRKREKEQIRFYHRLIQQLEQELEQHLDVYEKKTTNIKTFREDLEKAAKIRVTHNAVWRMNNDQQRLLVETVSLRRNRAILREKRARVNQRIHTLQELVRQPALSFTLCIPTNVTRENFEIFVNSLSEDHIEGIVDASLQRLTLFNRATDVFDLEDDVPVQEWNRLVATTHMKNCKYLFSKRYSKTDIDALEKNTWLLMKTCQNVWPGTDPWEEGDTPRIIRFVNDNTIFILCGKSILTGVFLLFRRQDGYDTVHGLQSVEFHGSSDLDSVIMSASTVRDEGIYTKKHALLFAYTLTKIRCSFDQDQSSKQGSPEFNDCVVKACGQIACDDQLTAKEILYQAFPSICAFEEKVFM
ncbi:hypothetical protein ABG067_004465 [Albugo candida]